MDELLALEPVVVNGETVYVNRFGDLWRWKCISNQYSSTSKFSKTIGNLTNKGYIHPRIGCKHVLQHRIIASAFLGLDITDLKIQVDHINGIRNDNRLENLRLVTCQQNHFNRTKARGYSWNKQHRKWQAKIKINGKTQHLGYFDTEESAHNAYLEAKEQLHII